MFEREEKSKFRKMMDKTVLTHLMVSPNYRAHWWHKYEVAVATVVIAGTLAGGTLLVSSLDKDNDYYQQPKTMKERLKEFRDDLREALGVKKSSDMGNTFNRFSETQTEILNKDKTNISAVNFVQALENV